MKEAQSLRGVAGPAMLCRGHKEHEWWGGADGAMAEKRWAGAGEGCRGAVERDDGLEGKEGDVVRRGDDIDLEKDVGGKGGGRKGRGWEGGGDMGQGNNMGKDAGTEEKSETLERRRKGEEDVDGRRRGVEEKEAKNNKNNSNNNSNSNSNNNNNNNSNAGGGGRENVQRAMVGINMTLNAFTGWGNLAYQTFFGFLQDPSQKIHPIMLAPLPPSASIPPAPHSSIIKGIYGQQNESRAEILSGRIGVPVIHSVDHERFDASSVSVAPNNITACPTPQALFHDPETI
jgi:hypothetical protein